MLKNISGGKDVFLRLPTDFGKYIWYEVLPFVLDSICSVRVVMPQAISSRKDSPICEDVVRLKVHVRKPVNYAHARAVCTRLFFSTPPTQRAWGRGYTHPHPPHFLGYAKKTYLKREIPPEVCVKVGRHLNPSFVIKGLK